MLYYKTAYVLAIFLVGFGSGVASVYYQPGDDIIIIAMGQLIVSVLTFPLGFIATAIGYAGVFTGFITPLEALLVTTPVHAVLGYVQWWRLFPWLYRSRV
ncbi:hypothetical protein IHQ71_06075 [Rhizobium sp. TH2]|uniref:hypothetical protein n=1 Tax=Rhizobium sp. TH2 TaxID=2775403 RepID=UPI0021577421|nr:hypothetical protein [Rhizobium sp. TH2]UVC10172.1 hypothetical protein IHQ71_06075 [Rhizobium sp. TH2]